VKLDQDGANSWRDVRLQMRIETVAELFPIARVANALEDLDRAQQFDKAVLVL
jgi:hypothetical protein